MEGPVRVHPVFLSRLRLALQQFDNFSELERTFLEETLDDIKTTFVDKWHELEQDDRYHVIHEVLPGFEGRPIVIGAVELDGIIEIRHIDIAPAIDRPGRTSGPDARAIKRQLDIHQPKPWEPEFPTQRPKPEPPTHGPDR